MRRIKTMTDLDRLRHVIIDVRDYRLMLAVVRAAEETVSTGYRHSLFKALGRFNAKPAKQTTPRHLVISTESDCEDQGYGAISDGCVQFGCNRAPIKNKGGWLKCTNCGGSYGAAKRARKDK
jgi:hypothetical protein